MQWERKKLDVMAKEREIFINGQVDENGNVIVPGCVRNGIDEVSANKIFDEMAELQNMHLTSHTQLAMQ